MRSNSELVRSLIDRELAVRGIQSALRALARARHPGGCLQPGAGEREMKLPRGSLLFDTSVYICYLREGVFAWLARGRQDRRPMRWLGGQQPRANCPGN